MNYALSELRKKIEYALLTGQIDEPYGSKHYHKPNPMCIPKRTTLGTWAQSITGGFGILKEDKSE